MKIVIGIGSRIKKDDNIGNLVAEALKKKKVEGCEFLIGEEAAENFLNAVKEKKPEEIFFIDAAEFKGSIGEVKIFGAEQLKNLSLTTTHTPPIGIFLKLLPKTKVKFIGIKVKEVDFGTSLSKEIKKLFPKITKKVESLISQ